MAGGSIYDLQRNLGHHSVAFTAAVYGHLSQDHRVKESDRPSGPFEAPAPAKVLPSCEEGDSNPHSFRNQILSPSGAHN
jgi:hypothetical protein